MTPSDEAAKPRSSRRGLIAGLAGFALVAVVIGMLVFQPWKLIIDVKVDEADPFAKAPAASVSTTAPSPTTSVTGAISTTASPGQTPTTTAAPGPTTAAPILGGSFTSLAHPTRGEVRAGMTPQGTQVVYLENFETDNGPDVKVYLSRLAADGDAKTYTKDALLLGDLKGNVGNQVYEIPSGTDLSTYRSVVIWCEKFSVAFGVAPLGSAASS